MKINANTSLIELTYSFIYLLGYPQENDAEVLGQLEMHIKSPLFQLPSHYKLLIHMLIAEHCRLLYCAGCFTVHCDFMV